MRRSSEFTASDNVVWMFEVQVNHSRSNEWEAVYFAARMA